MKLNSQLTAESYYFSCEYLEIIFLAAMIGNRHTQTVPTVQSGVGRRSNPPLLKSYQNLLVQRV